MNPLEEKEENLTYIAPRTESLARERHAAAAAHIEAGRDELLRSVTTLVHEVFALKLIGFDDELEVSAEWLGTYSFVVELIVGDYHLPVSSGSSLLFLDADASFHAIRAVLEHELLVINAWRAAHLDNS